MPRDNKASSHRAANAVLDVDVQDAARLRAMRWSTSGHVSKPQRLASGLLGLLWALVAGLPKRTPAPPPFSSMNSSLGRLIAFEPLYHRFCLVGSRSRTPGPPPFSSMNSAVPTPARLFRIAEPKLIRLAKNVSLMIRFTLGPKWPQPAFYAIESMLEIWVRFAKIWFYHL